MQSSGSVLKEKEEGCFSPPSSPGLFDGFIFCQCSATSRGFMQGSDRPTCCGKGGRERHTFLMWGEVLIQLVLLTKLHLLDIWKIFFPIPLLLCPALGLHWSQICKVKWLGG